MKIIQTFWTGPASAGDKIFDFKGGWLSSEYHWMSWSLSCLQLRKFYDDVELITDSRGKTILIDTLNLPYTKVSTALDGALDKYPHQLWSLAKIFSYNTQCTPFLHLDGDVFIWQPLDEQINNASIISQNKEENIFYYRDMLTDVGKYFKYISPSLKNIFPLPETIYASNTGIFGGNDLAFIKEYCSAAFELVDRNQELPQYVTNPQFNFLFEQCLLYYMAKEKGIDIDYVMREIEDSPKYENYVRFMDVPFIQLIHPVGGYKKMPLTCDRLARRLRKEYPEYYYEIINLFISHDLPIRSTVYETSMIPISPNNDMSETIPLKEKVNIKKKAKQHTGNSAEHSDLFRTIMCLEIELNKESTSILMPGTEEKSGLYDNLMQTVATIKESKSRNDILEILNLETRIVDLSRQFNDHASAQSLYNEDKINYQRADEIFISGIDAIMAASVRLNENAAILDVNKKWNDDSTEEDMKQFLKKLLNEEDSFNQVALVPNILYQAVDEIYLDNLEMIIANILRDGPKEIKDVLIESAEYFDSTELKDNLENYRKLIFDTIKLMLFSGILHIY